MRIATRLLRSQLQLLRPILTRESLEHSRTSQDQAGMLIKRRTMDFESIQFSNFEASFATPKECVGSLVILYLHGGGYTAGGLKYAEGFGSILAEKTGCKTFCAAYRLAPESPFPAALEDAAEAYEYLLCTGVEPKRIILAGESAGGGLCFSLALYLKEKGIPLPGGIVAISPWVDLTLTGESCTANKDGDPLLTLEQLRFFVRCYTEGQDVSNPLISPVFGDLSGICDNLIFAGDSELLLSDAKLINRKLTEAGVRSELHVRPEMWHGYILYGVDEADEDFERIISFVNEHNV